MTVWLPPFFAMVRSKAMEDAGVGQGGSNAMVGSTLWVPGLSSAAMACGHHQHFQCAQVCNVMSDTKYCYCSALKSAMNE